MLITSVNNQIEKERNEKIKQREREKRRQLYHEYILNPKLPQITDENSAAAGVSVLNTLGSWSFLLLLDNIYKECLITNISLQLNLLNVHARPMD